MRLSREFLARHFGDIWPAHNRAFTALLVECRRCFDGDLDAVLIMSAIGERGLTAERSRGLSYEAFLRGDRAAPARPVNMQSVADSTGIPRETVRRKVAWLIGRGWLSKCPDGTLAVTPRAALDLAPATQATLDYFLALGGALDRSLRDPAAEPVAHGAPDRTGAGD